MIIPRYVELYHRHKVMNIIRFFLSLGVISRIFKRIYNKDCLTAHYKVSLWKIKQVKN